MRHVDDSKLGTHRFNSPDDDDEDDYGDDVVVVGGIRHRVDIRLEWMPKIRGNYINRKEISFGN